MKAVVLETKDGYCAVLKDDGTVEKIRAVAQVGDEIDMTAFAKKESKVRRFPLRYVAAAASVAFVAVSSGYLSYMQDYSFVSMDVDASVEYSLNRMDRVVHVNAFDEKGESLAESVKQEGVEGNTLDEAVNKTADVLQRDGYMDSSEDVVLVSVSSKSEKKSSKLKKKMKDTLDKDEVKASIEDVSLEEREDARKSGLSTPRYAVVKNIVGEENLDEATIEVAKSKSTSELLSIAEEADEASAPDALLETELDTAAEADELGVCEEIHEDEPAPVEEDAAEDELDDLNEENDGHDDLTIDDDAEVEVTEKDLNVSSEKVEEVQTKAMSPSAIPLEGSVSEPEKNEITVEEPADKGILGPVESILQEVGF